MADSSPSGSSAEATDDPSFCPPGHVQQGDRSIEQAQWCESARGVKHGPFRAWYVTGQLEEEGTYDDGHRVGTWKTFDESGHLTSSRTFGVLVVCAHVEPGHNAVEGLTLWVRRGGEAERQTIGETDHRGETELDLEAAEYEVMWLGRKVTRKTMVITPERVSIDIALTPDDLRVGYRAREPSTCAKTRR